ncbi:MAG TPA: TlpA disulfide reductase family protein [Limnochordales bacterium]
MGNPAPDFALEDLSGRTVRLSSLRGRPVLLNFWATWCPPCLKELPELAGFHRRFQGRWEVVGVDVGEPRERVEAFVRRAGFGWTFLLDSSSRVAEAYLVVGLPTTYFIDAAGVVRARHLGPLTAEQLEYYRRVTEAAAPPKARTTAPFAAPPFAQAAAPAAAAAGTPGGPRP